ncbi:hypothetical protein B0H13DRAFT_1926213 [Mycena leptocephala]|nr:hypothetical protein B0H13DRAFT_1926213 [Mycena leptocephala]
MHPWDRGHRATPVPLEPGANECEERLPGVVLSSGKEFYCRASNILSIPRPNESKTKPLAKLEDWEGTGSKMWRRQRAKNTPRGMRLIARPRPDMKQEAHAKIGIRHTCSLSPSTGRTAERKQLDPPRRCATEDGHGGNALALRQESPVEKAMRSATRLGGIAMQSVLDAVEISVEGQPESPEQTRELKGGSTDGSERGGERDSPFVPRVSEPEEAASDTRAKLVSAHAWKEKEDHGHPAGGEGTRRRRGEREGEDERTDVEAMPAAEGRGKAEGFGGAREDATEVGGEEKRTRGRAITQSTSKHLGETTESEWDGKPKEGGDGLGRGRRMVDVVAADSRGLRRRFNRRARRWGKAVVRVAD